MVPKHIKYSWNPAKGYYFSLYTWFMKLKNFLLNFIEFYKMFWYFGELRWRKSQLMHKDLEWRIFFYLGVLFFLIIICQPECQLYLYVLLIQESLLPPSEKKNHLPIYLFSSFLNRDLWKLLEIKHARYGICDSRQKMGSLEICS